MAVVLLFSIYVYRNLNQRIKYQIYLFASFTNIIIILIFISIALLKMNCWVLVGESEILKVGALKYS